MHKILSNVEGFPVASFNERIITERWPIESARVFFSLNTEQALGVALAALRDRNYVGFLFRDGDDLFHVTRHGVIKLDYKEDEKLFIFMIAPMIVQYIDKEHAVPKFADLMVGSDGFIGSRLRHHLDEFWYDVNKLYDVFGIDEDERNTMITD